MASWTETVLCESLGLRPGERVLIMADAPLAEAAEALAAAAGEVGAGRVARFALPEPRAGLQLVPRGLAAAAGGADVLVCLRSDLDLAREDAPVRAARGALRQAGRGRLAVLAQVDLAVLEATLEHGLAEVERRAEELAGRMRAAAGAHLTAPGGTDLRLSWAGRPVLAETGRLQEPGSAGNLPPGEAYVAPHEARADGRLVVDVALGDIPLDGPVALTLRQGRVVEVAGGKAAAELRRRLGDDPWAWTIGEFGLGANPHVAPCDRVSLAEKALGTAHVALGGNRAFGGRNPAPTHYDCVIAAPAVRYLDA
ncbi:aminopeptidase [Symbiobacterium terraclitae]|uniref:aminopeptidase n=1 Tax=Symbiobacterium terraclitae TaxID=557451 RepID=UPI0035B52972